MINLTNFQILSVLQVQNERKCYDAVNTFNKKNGEIRGFFFLHPTAYTL
jgi:hypothetical protein